MIILLTGGSGSGKSRIAEEIIGQYDLKKYYIATMEPYGAEARAVISRHRKSRAGKGFETIERYTDIGGAAVPEGCAALIECMGNLCANEMFSARRRNPVEKILNGIEKTAARASVLVIVTNQVGRGGISYGRETMEYIKNMGEINRLTARIADAAAEIVYGIPVTLKGELPWRF